MQLASNKITRKKKKHIKATCLTREQISGCLNQQELLPVTISLLLSY